MTSVRSFVAMGSLLGAALALVGCLSELPGPTYVAHPSEELALVPFPPPPARVEIVPDRPRDDTLWVDGQWRWTGREWAWIYGAWVIPPEGARYSPWGAARDRAGRLFYAPGIWRDQAGRPIEAVQIVARGRASDENLVEDEGILEDTGPNLSPPRP